MNGQHSVVLDKGKIESALHTAFYPGSEPFQNDGVARLAGALCFYLTKAHAFQDGNKRTAYVLMRLILKRNRLDIEVDQDIKYDFVISAAKGELTFDKISLWIRKNLK